uniref:FAD_binding_2 domain-containing protein n=1 Tax=Globodera pallida TaxID=36090 RepID=A0A183CF48_GLOPA
MVFIVWLRHVLLAPFIGGWMASGKVMADVSPQRLDPALSAEKAPKKHEPVIVVGGGLAGMAATLEALSAGAHVILIDKEPMLGGNSAKGLMVVHESTSAVNFLIEQGVELADINLCGGHSVPRTHWLLSPKEGKPLPVGVAIIRAMKSKLDEWKGNNPEKFEVLLGMSVLGLVTWNDYVTGVRVMGEGNKISEINGKAVILTTGGFSSDRDNETSLLTEFAPDVLTLPTTNGPFATGDGVKMARAMGASLIGMKSVQIHPTAFIDPKNPSAHTKFLAAEALRGKGAILINEHGKRFGNELGRRDYLTEKINKNCARQKSVGDLPVAWMLMNNASADSFGRPAFNFYAKIKGFFTAFANADELASAIGCSVEQLHKTFAEYNEYVKMSESDEQFRDPFGKNSGGGNGANGGREPNLPKSFALCVLCVTIATILRPTTLFLWAQLILMRVWHLSTVSGSFDVNSAVTTIFRLASICLAPLGLSLLFDSLYYGKPVLCLWNFLQFNVLSGGSALFGANHWSWYLTHAVPPLLTFLIIPLLTVLFHFRQLKVKKRYAVAALIYLTGHSLISHKEHRFCTFCRCL